MIVSQFILNVMLKFKNVLKHHIGYTMGRARSR